MKKRILTAVILIFPLTLGGCFWSEEKEEREPITKGWSPKTFFNEAKGEMDADALPQAIELFEQLQAAYPSSKYARQAKLEIAHAHYKNKEYDDAITQLDDYIKLYPNDFSTPYAYYLQGVASEEKATSFFDEVLTDNAERDISGVRDAFHYYLALIQQFPDSPYAEEVRSRLVILKNILARHELFVAVFYTKKQAHIAAVNRCRYIIENYPNTPSVAAALHLMAHNYDALNAPELAADTRRVLARSYPNYQPHYSLEP